MSEYKELMTLLKVRIMEYARTAKEDGPFGNPKRTEPFRSNGLVFIHQPSFRKWIGEKYHVYVSQPQAMAALVLLKGQPRLLNFKNKFGRKVYGLNIEENHERTNKVQRLSV